MYNNIPFLNNKETVGMIPGDGHLACIGFDPDTAIPQGSIPEWEKRKNYNRQRCLRMTRQVKQNQINHTELQEYLLANDLEPNTLQYLLEFRYKLSTCCHHSLFREHLSNGALEFIGAHTCKHKLCAVCNAQRSKKVRQSYRRFFEKYPDLLEKYDFMHLTLTVPHDEVGGFRGKRWYADELMKEFNYMRKKSFWKQHVYAGEFGIEVTKNEKGLHVHIHALLLVNKSRQNRNELHKHVLKAWNRQTSGSGQRKEITAAEKAAMMKGNRLLSPLEIDHLAPDGATFIGLESLYLSSKEQKAGFHFCERAGHWKKYISPSDGFDLCMSGIMECIKYHFQPMAMYEDGKLDLNLIREILPTIKGKPLYRKFGAFHAGSNNAHPGSKMLNVNFKEKEESILKTIETDLGPSSEESIDVHQEIKALDLNEKIAELKEEMAKELAENGDKQVVNPETGENCLREEYQYFTVSLSKTYIDPEDGMRIKIAPNVKRNYLHHTRNALDALMEMELLAMSRQAA